MIKTYYLMLGIVCIVSQLHAQTGKNWFYNINEKNVAIEGYDVVAYFSQSEAIKGENLFSHEFEGVNYHFVNKKNKNLFVKNPQKYLPSFGGWCAFFMGVDKSISRFAASRVKPDPTNFLIVKNKLYLFVKNKNNDGKKQFEAGNEKLILSNAKSFWKTRLEYASRSNGLPKGMNANARMELIEWLPFIGNWDGTAKWWADTTGNTWGGQNAEWSFYFGFNGYCIQDDWKPYNEGFFAGTSSGPAIRGFDPQNNEWHMTFIPVNQPRETTWMMKGKFVEKGKIVGTLENVDWRGKKYIQRVEFTSISDEKFEWRAHRSYDGGNSWNENMMMTDCIRKEDIE